MNEASWYFLFIGIAAVSLCWYFRADITRWWRDSLPWNLERDGSVNERIKRVMGK